MAKIYRSISDYLRDIATANSDALGWKSIRVWLAADASNCVRFTRMKRNTIKVTLSGTARHSVRLAEIYDTRPTRAGDAILMPAGFSAELSWVTLGAVEETIVVEFDDDFFETYCADAVTDRLQGGNLVPTSYSNKFEAVTLIRMLARELDDSSRRGPKFAEAAIRLLALEIVDSDWFRIPVKISEKTDITSRVNKVIKMIDAEYANDISLADLASSAGLSMSHLISLFKRRTGRTPHAYLIDRRIERAVDLLCSTSRPIATIAIESGFLDQSQMTKMFRKRLACTPRSVRLRGLGTRA